MSKFNELEISKQIFLDELKVEVECSSSYLEKLSKRLEQWLIAYQIGEIGTPYQSKSDRLSLVTDNKIDELSVAILYCTLALDSDRFQELISKVESMVTICEDKWNNTRTIAEALAYCNGVIYNLVKPKAFGDYYEVERLVTISEILQAKLTRLLFLPPAKYEPLDWTSKYDGGYAYSRHYAILGSKYNKHNDYINIKVLNDLQRIPYELTSVVDLDEEFEPKCKDSESREQAIKQFELRQKIAKEIYAEYKNIPFYFIWQYDKRGRLYSRGYDLNIQGNEYRKASLRFHNKEKLTDRGIYWLKIDMANTFGLDKETFDKRVSFINKNIKSMLSNPDEWIAKADEPLLFKIALESYQEGVVEGKPIGHIVRLDATTSGPQLMSTIMRDKSAMKHLNVIGDKTRFDFYTLVAKETYKNSTNDPVWGEGKVDFKAIRSIVKKPIMTFFYNSEAKPKEMFGEDSVSYNAFLNALEKYASKALVLKDFLNDCFDKTAYYHSWHLPDGHYSYCPVEKLIQGKTIELHELGKHIKIKYEYTDNQPNYKAWRSLDPSIIHSIDAWVCRTVISNLSDRRIDVSPIHDSFGVHPNYCDDLRAIYRGCLARLYKEPIIDDIVSEITGKDIKVTRPKFSQEIYKEIINNEKGYYIC